MQHFGRTFLLGRILDLAETYGVARTSILHEIGFDERTARQTAVWIESSKLVDAAAYAAILTGRKDFGLNLGMNNDHRTLGSLGIFVEHCQSMTEMVSEGSRYLHLHNSALRFSILPGRERKRLRLQVLAHGKYPQLQYVEGFLTMLVRFWRTMLGPQWHPIAVMFEHESTGARESYRRAFGCPVQFGTEMNCIVASKSDCERRITPHDGRIKHLTQQMLEEYARVQQPDLREQIEILLLPLIPAGKSSATIIARHLSITPRTLQRKLAERGTTLKKMVTDARLQLARGHMKDETLNLSKLASILGFSEASAVSRFLRQNGLGLVSEPRSRRRVSGK